MKTLTSTLFLLLMTAASAIQANTVEMDVNGLVCAFCAQGIEKTLKGFDATAEVFVSLENRIVAVALKEGAELTDEELTKAITDSGYAVVAIRRSDLPLQAIRDRVTREADDE